MRVAAILHEHILATSVTLPMEILRGAAQFEGHVASETLRINCYSTAGGQLTLQSGLILLTEPLSALQDVDLLIVPAIWRDPLRVMRRHPEHVEKIGEHINRGSRLVSVGSGTFLLAETGLLTGRLTTTHWHWFEAFAHRYPDVYLERERLITQSEQVFCVSSVNSVADLMVYLCGNLFSQKVARHIENQFSPEIRKRFSPATIGISKNCHTDELVADVQIELSRDLRNLGNLKKLSAHLGISTRTLSRRFKMATGVPPGAYLQKLRLDEAQALLRRTNLSVTEIGLAVGLSDASNFTRMFRSQIGLSPRDYRAAVRSKSFAVSNQLE